MAGKKGKSGRKPKPLQLLKLSGGYRPDRHAAREINLPTKVPNTPKILQGRALAEWHRITKLLSTVEGVTELDLKPLVAYCIESAKYEQANEDIAKTKTLLVRSTKGTPMANPLLKISDRAYANMMRAASEFGFTILARRTLRIEPEPGIVLDDDLDEFFG